METAITTKRLSKIFTASTGILCISLLFAGMFLYTAFFKLRAPNDFLGAMNANVLLKPFTTYDINGVPVFAFLLTYGVPFVEILLSLLFVFNVPIGKTPSRKIALVAGGVLILLFTIYIVTTIIIYQGKTLPCTCGGFVGKLSWREHIFFNLGFVLLSVFGLLLYKKQSQSV